MQTTFVFPSKGSSIIRPGADTVTGILWRAAGSPRDTTDKRGNVDSVPHDGLCWWCGHPAPGWARPRSILPKTFPYPLQSAAPDSVHICLPCGWTLCDRIRLPHDYAIERIKTKARQGRRQIVSVRGKSPARWLTLELDNGTVGLWEPASSARFEKPWTDAIKVLRGEPADVGPCRFVEAVDYAELDAGPVEKFRSFHHFATRDQWWACTDTNRADIREWLLRPPEPPWVGVIGEGKKHHAIEAQRLDALTTSNARARVYYLGAVVSYVPATLARQIAAVEELVRLGAGDDEILTGEYRPHASTEWLLALRRHDPVINEIRGGPTLGLCLYLRRNRKELKNAD
jgi:hypothetical protein